MRQSNYPNGFVSLWHEKKQDNLTPEKDAIFPHNWEKRKVQKEKLRQSNYPNGFVSLWHEKKQDNLTPEKE